MDGLDSERINIGRLLIFGLLHCKSSLSFKVDCFTEFVKQYDQEGDKVNIYQDEAGFPLIIK